MIVQNVTTGACTPQTIVIGRRGTYDTMQIAFDLSYLIESYGSGTAVLAVKRSQDESAYPAVVTQEDSKLLWTVNETDTAYVGSGECQLMWYVDGGLAKTIIYPMVVMRDILQTAEEPPDGYENWIERLTDLGAETQQNAQNAAQSASDASTAKDDAVTAKEAAVAAQQAAETAVTHYPVIINGYWNVWSVEAQSYVSTGIQAEGEDGYSPEVTITSIEGGHRVTITDKDHPQGQSFDVLDGQGGGGSSDYATLSNKPKINNVELDGNKTAHDLGLAAQTDIPTVPVQSVAGKTGAVNLGAGDVGFNSSEEYNEGTVGAELSELNRQLSDSRYLDLDAIAYGTKTYADIFCDGTVNLISSLYFDSGTFSPAIINAGTPEIVDFNNPVTLSHKVLKCFGDTSQQIGLVATLGYTPLNVENRFCYLTKNHAYFLAAYVNVVRYSTGKCGISLSGTGVPDSATFARTTNGFELVRNWGMYSSNSGTKDCFIGTISSADADCYVCMPVILDMTSIGFPNLDTADGRRAAATICETLYKNYVSMTSTLEIECNKLNSIDQKYAVTVMDATSAANRFLAAKQLLDVARKKAINPYYIPKNAEIYLAIKGVVCKLPSNSGAFYEQYSFNKLFAVDETSQSIPASTTKVLSAITALDYIGNLYEQYTFTSDDIQTGSGSVYQVGDVLTVKDMLYAMMLESSNTCATALATMCGKKILRNDSATFSEAQTAFVSSMNKKADEIGCENSLFTASSGGNVTSRSTAQDLLRILIEASAYNDLIRIWGKKEFTIHVSGDNARDVDIETTVANTILESDYYIFGGKTGSWESSEGNAKTLVLIAKPIIKEERQ